MPKSPLRFLRAETPESPARMPESKPIKTDGRATATRWTVEQKAVLEEAFSSAGWVWDVQRAAQLVDELSTPGEELTVKHVQRWFYNTRKMRMKKIQEEEAALKAAKDASRKKTKKKKEKKKKEAAGKAATVAEPPAAATEEKQAKGKKKKKEKKKKEIEAAQALPPAASVGGGPASGGGDGGEEDDVRSDAADAADGDKGAPASRGELRVRLPQNLKQYLVYEFQTVAPGGASRQKRTPRCALPASPCIAEVLDRWMAATASEVPKKSRAVVEGVEDVIAGLRSLVDELAAEGLLFYPGEKDMYERAGPGGAASATYGAEHLLRCITLLPRVLPAQTERELGQLQNRIKDLTRFLSDNYEAFFPARAADEAPASGGDAAAGCPPCDDAEPVGMLRPIL